MKSASQIHLSDVQAVYSGTEGWLGQLLMGEQIGCKVRTAKDIGRFAKKD